jgi:hypothetical protein
LKDKLLRHVTLCEREESGSKIDIRPGRQTVMDQRRNKDGGSGARADGRKEPNQSILLFRQTPSSVTRWLGETNRRFVLVGLPTLLLFIKKLGSELDKGSDSGQLTKCTT